MTLEEKIDEFRSFIIDDIEAAINGNANYLAALGLASYTEFLGGLYRCDHSQGNARKNYNKGLEKLGDQYDRLLQSHGDVLYPKIRCGLVHEYFIKGTAQVSNKEESPNGCGIVYDNNIMFFYVSVYFEHFLEAIRKYIDDMKDDNNLEDYFLGTWRTPSTTLTKTTSARMPSIPANRNVSSR